MLIRQTLLYAPASIVGPLLQMSTIIFWTHWLQPVELGLYSMVIAFQDLLHLAGIAWWSQYVLRYGAMPSHEPDRRLLSTDAFILLASGACQSGVLLLLAKAALDYEIGLPQAAVLVGLTLGRTVLNHWMVRARAEQRIGLYAMAQTLAPALGLLLSLSLFAAGGDRLSSALSAMAIAHVLVASSLGVALGFVGTWPRVDRSVLRAACTFGIFTTGAALAGWVSLQSVRFIVDHTIGTVAVGLMSVGWGIGQRIATQLGLLITMAALPLAVATTRQQGQHAGLTQLHLSGYVLACVLMPAVLGLSFLSVPAANLVVAEPYRAVTAQILGLATLAGAARAARHHYLDDVVRLIERPKLLMLISIAEAALTAALCVGGAAVSGVVGAVAGATAAAVITTVCLWAALSRLRATPRLSTYWPMAAASMTLAMFLYIAGKVQDPFSMFFVATAGGTLYCGVLLVCDPQLARIMLRWL